MDKTFFIDIDNDGGDKMVFKFKDLYSGSNKEKDKSLFQLRFYKLLQYYCADPNQCVTNIVVDINNDNSVFLNVMLVDGIKSKNYIRDKIGVLKKQNTILCNPFHVFGECTKYDFTFYNIEDTINEKSQGIYIFTIMVDNRYETTTWQTQYSQLLLRFDTILGDKTNKECIEYAKNNGALYFLYYPTEVEHEIDKIISDIKNSNTYIQQLKDFPEMVIHND